MLQEVIMVIEPNGDVRIETKGFTGSACLKATAKLEKALGRKVSDVLTANIDTPAVRVLERE